MITEKLKKWQNGLAGSHLIVNQKLWVPRHVCQLLHDVSSHQTSPASPLFSYVKGECWTRWSPRVFPVTKFDDFKVREDDRVIPVSSHFGKHCFLPICLCGLHWVLGFWVLEMPS